MKTFCARTDLTNESDVELFFIGPLLKYLGYKNNQIKNKKSLKELGVRKSPRGKATKYRPDFLVVVGNTMGSSLCMIQQLDIGAKPAPIAVP